MENDKKISNGVKKIGTYLICGGVLFFVVALIYANSNSTKTNESGSVELNPEKDSSAMEDAASKSAEKVQIYLFHPTSRCYSCVTAGDLVKKTINQDFKDELDSGRLEYIEINIDLTENKEIAKKFKAFGTSLYINAIIDGNENIKEDAKVWRLISNEDDFMNYFSDKLKGVLGETALAKTEEEKKAVDMILFFGNNCADCDKVRVYIKENEIKKESDFQEKDRLADNALMKEKMKDCEMEEMEIEEVFLWANGRCYLGSEDVIDFFEQKLKNN
ncbi:MAG: nitrophenyl compound nitroreductase subunit ArsF family protein [Candidatus Moraniibacteriota bacterium]